MNVLGSILAGPSGKASSMRASAILVVLLVLGPRAYVAVKTEQATPVAAEDAALVVGVLAVKGWQRGKEEPKP